MDAVTTLPDDLAALLERHGVAATVDGVLAAFEARKSGMQLTYLIDRSGWVCWSHETWPRSFLGSTALAALARAFAAMVETEEGA
jgi:hypothetical protein